MKRYYLPMLTIIMVSIFYMTCAGEQERQERQRRMDPEQMTGVLTEKLDLSDEQAGKIKAILIDSQEKMRSIRDEAKGDRSVMRDQMRQVREDTDELIMAELDETQKGKFRELQEERRQERRERNRERSEQP